jgi:predicted dehydrogenase
MIETLSQDWPAPSRPKPIVIVGAGGIVRDAHLPAYTKAGLEVAGVTDLDPSRSESLARDHGIRNVHPSVGATVGAHGTEVVYDVAVPPSAITAILPDLPDGAAVLIQKPMGADLRQAREIRAICREKRLKAAVNFQLRFSPMMMAARQAVERGFIGEPLEIEVHLNIFTPWTLFPFLLPMRRVEILVHSIHYLDSIRAIFGTPEVSSHARYPTPARQASLRPAHRRFSTGATCGAGSDDQPQPPGRAPIPIRVVPDRGHRGRHDGQARCLLRLPPRRGRELWFCPSGGEWRQVPLMGSWFIDAFMGPMRNLQRFDSRRG